MVKTLASHAGIRGSTPLGTTKLKPLEFQRFRGFFVHCNFHILGDKHPHLALFLPESVAKYQETSIAMPSMLKFHNVINLRVVRNIFHISHYFYCKYAIIVVRKEVGVFIKILTKTYKGEKRYYASLVENKRIDGKVVQRVKANLGPVTEEQIPYLKAAYARKKPHLVYDDE